MQQIFMAGMVMAVSSQSEGDIEFLEEPEDEPSRPVLSGDIQVLRVEGNRVFVRPVPSEG
jgi:hypothetical protein